MLENNSIIKSFSWLSAPPQVSDVVHSVPDAVLIEFEKYIEINKSVDTTLYELDRSVLNLPLMEKWVSALIPTIKDVPGFACLRVPDTYSNKQLKHIYHLISIHLGTLNDRYGLLFDVQDQGFDHTKQAIPVSKSNAETSYHTDSTALEYIPDIVGLLCINTAKSGGESLIANAADIYLDLNERRPDLIPSLSAPIIRDVITPGSEQNKESILRNKFPIFSLKRKQFVFRYMRYWVESGYRKTQTPPPDNLFTAMDEIDSYLDDESHVFKYQMSRGDMIYINNLFLCHNRTGFVDYDDANKKRRLVRTWINWYAD